MEQQTQIMTRLIELMNQMTILSKWKRSAQPSVLCRCVAEAADERTGTIEEEKAEINFQ